MSLEQIQPFGRPFTSPDDARRAINALVAILNRGRMREQVSLKSGRISRDSDEVAITTIEKQITKLEAPDDRRLVLIAVGYYRDTVNGSTLTMRWREADMAGVIVDEKQAVLETDATNARTQCIALLHTVTTTPKQNYVLTAQGSGSPSASATLRQWSAVVVGVY